MWSLLVECCASASACPLFRLLRPFCFFTLEIVSRKASGEVFGVDVSMMRGDRFVGRKFESVTIFRINKVC